MQRRAAPQEKAPSMKKGTTCAKDHFAWPQRVPGYSSGWDTVHRGFHFVKVAAGLTLVDQAPEY